MIEFKASILARVQQGALVVAGSRGLIGYHGFAQYACKLASERGWCIVVGDARGVDTLVIRMSKTCGVPLVVLGCQAVGELRLTPHTSALTQLIPGGQRSGSCFVIRDEALATLAATSEQHGFIGLWNGKSRGTQHTAKFCRLRGIPGMLMLPDGRVTQRWGKTNETQPAAQEKEPTLAS